MPWRRRALAEVGDDFGGGGGADVGGEEREFEVVEGSVVDFAGEGDDGGDRLGKRFAGAGDRLLHAVEEAGLALETVGLLRRAWSRCRVCRR